VTTLRNRIISAVAGIGFAVMAAVSPVAAQAAVVPHTQNIYQDINQLTAAGQTSLYIQEIGDACFTRAIDFQLQQICQNLFLGQAMAQNNDRHLIYSLVGTWPNNFQLNSAERNNVNVINNFKFDFVTVGGGTESQFVGLLSILLLDNGIYSAPVGNGTVRILPVLTGLTGAFTYGLYVTSHCQYSAFAPAVRSYCGSLNRTYGYNRNIFENYVTFTQGTPFAPPPVSNPFQG
jgi:hypothetical protein